LEDQTSWPAPAEVLIKDKAKEQQNDSSEKKQQSVEKKEDSPKKGTSELCSVTARGDV
jgi:hypothetical protein